MEFSELYSQFLLEFGKGKTMVLSTSYNDKVTSRMMSIILINNKFYFQTDWTLRKYDQIINNPNIALCIDNIQIEGLCKEVGRPIDDTDFCDTYRECFKSSYERYTTLENERLFEITPLRIERWRYMEGNPYIELFDVESKVYSLTPYK